MPEPLPDHLLVELEQAEIEWAIVSHQLFVAPLSVKERSRGLPVPFASNRSIATETCERLLLESSKDVRLGLYWAQAQGEARGLSGVADGMWLIRELWRRFRHPTLEDPDSEWELLKGIVAKVQVALLRVVIAMDSHYTYTSVLNADRDPETARGIEAALARTPLSFYRNFDGELTRVQSECFEFKAAVGDVDVQPVVTLLEKIRTTLAAWARALRLAEDPDTIRFWPERTPRARRAAVQQQEAEFYLHLDGLTAREEPCKGGAWMIISGYQHQTRRPSKDSALHPRVLKIHKRLDRVSPAIQEACNRARPIPLAILEVRAGDSIILLRAELQNAVIEEVQQIAEQKKVEECLKLTYDRILWIYHVYREDGSLEGVTCSTCCAPSPTPRGFIQSRP